MQNYKERLSIGIYRVLLGFRRKEMNKGRNMGRKDAHKEEEEEEERAKREKCPSAMLMVFPPGRIALQHINLERRARRSWPKPPRPRIVCVLVLGALGSHRSTGALREIEKETHAKTFVHAASLQVILNCFSLIFLYSFPISIPE